MKSVSVKIEKGLRARAASCARRANMSLSRFLRECVAEKIRKSGSAKDAKKAGER